MPSSSEPPFKFNNGYRTIGKSSKTKAKMLGAPGEVVFLGGVKFVFAIFEDAI